MTEYYIGILILVGINVVAILGVSVMTGFTKVFSFGNAGFMSIGAYTSAILTTKLGAPFLVALFAGALLATAIGYLLGKLTLGLRGDYFLITTLGLGEGIRVTMEIASSLTGGARGLSGIPQYTTLPIVIASAVIGTIIVWNFLHSKFGRNLKAIREQEIAARAIGIDIAKYKRMSLMICAFFTAWAGGLLAHYMMFATPLMFGIAKSSELTITVVIGGIGSLTGSILAAIVVTILPEILRSMVEYRMLIYGIVVVLIITLRPQGLLGYKEFSITRMIRKTRALLRKTVVRK